MWSVELYPLHGYTRCDAPRTQYDACVVAWGGVLAQGAIALPLVLYTSIFGFTAFGPLNALLAVFGYLSVVIAVFNLIPLGRLDGVIAWRIVPYLWRNRRAGRRRSHVLEDHRQESRGDKGGWVH